MIYALIFRKRRSQWNNLKNRSTLLILVTHVQAGPQNHALLEKSSRLTWVRKNLTLFILMKNLILTYRKDQFYFIKNNFNGAIFKFDEDHYSRFIRGDEEIYSRLKLKKFFVIEEPEDTISIFVLTNYSCNLSCPYCFERHKNSFLLSCDDWNKFFNKLEGFLVGKNLRKIDITFTGGEPLVNFKCVVDITDSIKMFAAKNSLLVQFSIITNGTLLTPFVLDFLNKNNFFVQITFDGVKKVHDSIRCFSNGMGTYDLILEKLERMTNFKNLKIVSRINISSRDFSLYQSLIDHLMVFYPKVGVYIDFVDVPPESELFLNNEEKIDIFCQYLRIMTKNGRRDFYNYYEGGRCMLRNKMSFAIDPSLSFYRCYSFAGTEYLKFKNYEGLLANSLTNDYSCPYKECEFYSFCMGGCVYKKYILSGDVDIFCKRDFLMEMNSLIFLSEIYKNDLPINFKELLSHVEYSQIDFH